MPKKPLSAAPQTGPPYLYITYLLVPGPPHRGGCLGRASGARGRARGGARACERAGACACSSILTPDRWNGGKVFLVCDFCHIGLLLVCGRGRHGGKQPEGRKIMTRKDFEKLAGVVRDQPSDFMAGEPRQVIRLDTERAVLAGALADV